MNATVDLTRVPVLAFAAGVAILLFAAVGIVWIGVTIWMGYRGEMRHRRAEVEPEPTEPQPEPEPVVEAAAEVAVEPEPTPAVVEVVVFERPLPDLLPPAPPHRYEVPTFCQVPVPLPKADSIDWRFSWERPAVDFPTGSFPVVVLSDDIEGYQVSEVPNRQLDGFAVDPNTRGRFIRSDADMSALAAAQGFDRSGRRPVRDPAMDEVAKLLPEKRSTRKATVDLEAGTVTVPA